MSFDVGRVFAITFTMIKKRILLLLGLWLVFFVASIVVSMMLGGMLGISTLGASSMAEGGGLDSPGELLGRGIVAMLGILVFYVLTLTITFAQQASMTAMASPFEKPLFGEAMLTGLKSGLTFVALMLMLIVAYFIVGLLAVLAVALLSMISETVGLVIGVIFIPALIYIFCRLAVIMPVVAVERVFNPITAINRTWSLTRGHVLGILLVVIVGIIVALALLALPIFLIFGSSLAALGNPATAETAAAALGGMVFAGFLLVPLFLVYQIFSVALNASLHSAISDHHPEKMREVFE